MKKKLTKKTRAKKTRAKQRKARRPAPLPDDWPRLHEDRADDFRMHHQMI